MKRKHNLKCIVLCRVLSRNSEHILCIRIMMCGRRVSFVFLILFTSLFMRVKSVRWRWWWWMLDTVHDRQKIKSILTLVSTDTTNQLFYFWTFSISFHQLQSCSVIGSSWFALSLSVQIQFQVKVRRLHFTRMIEWIYIKYIFGQQTSAY